jgi:rhodanese-related sulfurtransferase
MIREVDARTLRGMLADGGELALTDLREELPFSASHLLHARCVPLSRLELKFARLVPRLGTRIVLCDDGEGLTARGYAVLRRAGYTDVAVLASGIAAWAAAGFELFSGVNVPSKAFGEFIEHACHTPSVSAHELDALLRGGADVRVVDSRPFDEYSRVSIPTSTNVPGAELVLRVRAVAPSPDTLVVVNCAGRTRSIIGAQSLINAGLPNKVVALRNGTMGWELAGLTCESGKAQRAPDLPDGMLAWSKEAADRVACQCGVTRIDDEAFGHWKAEMHERTLYVFDVRDPAEYAAGHVPGAISAPGGQLVQATDQYVGTLGARIVLIDDRQVRAQMTASWLRQMGWKDVAVLVAAGDETGWPAAPLLDAPRRSDLRMDAAELATLLAQGAATVVDLSMSRDYRQGHIPGAWFAIRARLTQALLKIAPQGTLVLTSEDGVLAELAAAEACAMTDRAVRTLAGGNAAWRAAGHPLTPDEPRMADEGIDAWLKPYERAADTATAMADYLAWETDLLPRIARDGSCAFSQMVTSTPRER